MDESMPISIISSKQKEDIRISILKRLDKYIKSKTLFSKPKNSVFLFSLGLSVDSLGNVDNVFFSNDSLRNTSEILVVNDNLIGDLKKMQVDNLVYKNKILIFSVLFKRPEDDKISNFNEFLTSFSSLWPAINPNIKREVLLLQPFINDFFDPVN
ncbi:hypothetical protein ACFSNA_13795 [Pedobacter mendelii]|uniref:Uncharacterized protein n=2 Tax=Pedobacter mendelii TaxID=1908240 RepID=A0ABQ2BIH0_9SPHI|nr:hypothetical protein GCM10008119_11440 [Pedobacter mendelii]